MTLLDFVRLTRHNIGVILLCALIGATIGAAYSFTRPLQFQSTAIGVVVAGSGDSLGGVSAGSSLAEKRAGSYVALMDTTTVWDRIRQDPEVQANPDAGKGAISATVVPNSPMIRVTARSSTAANSVILANAAMRSLAAEAAQLESVNVNEQGQEVDPSQLIIKVVPYQQATGAGQLNASDWIRNILIGLVAGLAIGFGIAFVRKQLDVRVRTVADVEELTGHGVLAIIPDTRELGAQRNAKDGERSADMGIAAEALRQLRTNLRYVNVDDPPKTVAITSSNPGEGKSTVAANLARLMASAGQPTILVDADLRKPVQHANFGLDDAVGLTQVLAGVASIADALQPTSQPNLRVLTAGRIPPNPSEILGSQRMRNLIQRLARNHFVIVDVPPMLAVTDPGLVAASCDGALLVSRVGKTYKEQLRLSTKLLEQVGANLLGAVLHRAPRKAMGEVVYGAGYGGSYGSYYGDHYRREEAPVEVPHEEPEVEPERQLEREPAPAPAAAPERALSIMDDQETSRFARPRRAD